MAYNAPGGAFDVTGSMVYYNYSELDMKSEVSNVFDGIVTSVEAQRNEALQSVSQLRSEGDDGGQSGSTILDSFTRFADYT